jgi:hypothetical protein
MRIVWRIITEKGDATIITIDHIIMTDHPCTVYIVRLIYMEEYMGMGILISIHMDSDIRIFCENFFWMNTIHGRIMYMRGIMHLFDSICSGGLCGLSCCAAKCKGS